ncbi:hypothetical protein [Amycolatopsis sp. YIM 10]|uniref:hypothetical protein n=1 Tax=Amycolatopsis sp. YIM 10 TaxID=2653857 RepID=UPI0012901DE6|nr:hypothetical protein [Amycolatopsis sp. YIM 10]QFU88493.1 hypothetical protein YIM_16565 [Amycolatopsis sp. YIM 10]
MGKVLVIGVDPATVPGLDVEAIEAALARGQARFAEHGIEADLCTVALDEHATRKITEALERADYRCVVIGGGIRKPEPLLEFFEQVVNLVRRHAPGAAIAFNTSPEDSLDAALRWWA